MAGRDYMANEDAFLRAAQEAGRVPSTGGGAVHPGVPLQVLEGLMGGALGKGGPHPAAGAGQGSGSAGAPDAAVLGTASKDVGHIPQGVDDIPDGQEEAERTDAYGDGGMAAAPARDGGALGPSGFIADGGVDAGLAFGVLDGDMGGSPFADMQGPEGDVQGFDAGPGPIPYPAGVPGEASPEAGDAAGMGPLGPEPDVGGRPAGSKGAAGGTSAKARKAPGRKRSGDAKGSQIRDFPVALLNECRRMFPDASSQRDAVAAFVYSHLPNKVDGVPDHIVELSKTGTDHAMGDIRESLYHIQRAIAVMSSKMDAVDMVQAYLLSNAMGVLRMGQSPSHARNANIAVEEVADMGVRIHEEAKAYKDKVRNMECRPY